MTKSCCGLLYFIFHGSGIFVPQFGRDSFLNGLLTQNAFQQIMIYSLVVSEWEKDMAWTLSK